jgi:uncharacterized protein (DUF2062 family)
MNQYLRRWLPTPEALRANRWLRWLGPALHHPRLWHMSRRGIALGMAIGVFFGLLIPVAQIPLSAAAAIVLRANVPSAVASTLVTNPVTFAPVYYAAWRVGSALLGKPPARGAEPPGVLTEAMQGSTAVSGRPEAGFSLGFDALGQGLSSVGKPLVLGLALFACTFGLAVYLLVHAAWLLHVRLKRRRRLRRAVRVS